MNKKEQLIKDIYIILTTTSNRCITCERIFRLIHNNLEKEFYNNEEIMRNEYEKIILNYKKIIRNLNDTTPK